jgi:pimeloyl-ACP methyl ester carboxylesterase
MNKQFYLNKIALLFISALIFTFITTAPATSHAQTAVKNIVLVHGAFADGSGWEGVYKALTKRGYNVSVVGNPNTGFADDVAATKRVLAKQDGPVVLVGHSYGGAVITEAGNATNVVGLVYVDAFAPDANETLAKLAQSVPAPNSGILPPDKDGFVWYDKAKFHSGFCADLSADKADFLFASQVPLAASVFAETIASPAWKQKPSWFVIGTQDETIPPEGQRFMANRAKSTITEIRGSHLTFMSQPKAVADVIEVAAKATAEPLAKVRK